jgi:hypothetical protein
MPCFIAQIACCHWGLGEFLGELAGVWGDLCATGSKGDAELKVDPQATTGLGGGTLRYPQQDVSAERASISVL